MGASFIDISPPLHAGIAVWPGDVAFSRELTCSFDDAGVAASSVRTTLHAGAHADAPSHLHRDGASIDQRDLALYYGPCEVVEVMVAAGGRVPPVGAVRAPRVLFKTGSSPDPDAFDEDFAALSPELIDDLALQGVVLVGIDTPSVDPFRSVGLESHKAAFANDLAILEGLVLDEVQPGLYTLIALPLKVVGADASPVRAVLMTD